MIWAILSSTHPHLSVTLVYSVSVLTFSGYGLSTFLILSLTLVTWSFCSLMHVSAWPMSQCFSVVIILQSLLFILSFSFLFAISVAYTAYVPCSLYIPYTRYTGTSAWSVQSGHWAKRLSTRDNWELAAMWMLSLWKDQSVLLTTEQSLQPPIFFF